MSNTNKKYGFTLIELLVVVSIIALLSSVILGALQDARVKARDRALFSGVLELQKAVELYKLKYGVYPQRSDGQANVNITRDSDGAYSSNNDVQRDYILPQIREFIPDMPQPTAVGGFVSFYHSPSFTCTDNLTAPYMILFTPENMSSFSNLPSGRRTTTTGAISFASYAKCLSGK